ncbi:hypothetical protein MSU_0776 [Mycoplasma suis str. Illinois]|uniref:Uncharacterized protein n=2 Tax=Mycoplasma suis TaxID=57372 RepID=F0QS31_MYCSL|nr:hypothetical protein MSU_0776 [Mycoplasma suis str. Illinois]
MTEKLISTSSTSLARTISSWFPPATDQQVQQEQESVDLSAQAWAALTLISTTTFEYVKHFVLETKRIIEEFSNWKMWEKWRSIDLKQVWENCVKPLWNSCAMILGLKYQNIYKVDSGMIRKLIMYLYENGELGLKNFLVFSIWIDAQAQIKSKNNQNSSGGPTTISKENMDVYLAYAENLTRKKLGNNWSQFENPFEKFQQIIDSQK